MGRRRDYKKEYIRLPPCREQADSRPEWVDVEAVEIHPDHPSWPDRCDPAVYRVWIRVEVDGGLKVRVWRWKHELLRVIASLRRIIVANPEGTMEERRLLVREEAAAKRQGLKVPPWVCPPGKPVKSAKRGPRTAGGGWMCG